jgi:hypothetical protein
MSNLRLKHSPFRQFIEHLARERRTHLEAAISRQMMALHTSPCKAHSGQGCVHAWEGDESGQGRGTHDTEDGGIEGDVAEAAQLGGLADDGAGAREAEARGNRRHVHGPRRVGGDRRGAAEMGIGEGAEEEVWALLEGRMK